MKCIVPSQNVKIIARAIHSLAKIGDEMFIEPTENEIIFRTVNMAQSAFAEFRMWKSFFSSFLFNENEDNEALCKITMRSCIGVFKNAHSMEKQVESCEIRMKPEATVVIFQIKFTNSHVKKYFLPILDSEKLEANVPNQTINCIMASSKFLSSTVKNFRQSEDEITIAVEKEKIFIKNHLELRKDQNFMRTELCFHPTEFESYEVGNPTFVTFCFKELRAVLSFAEPSNLSIQMSFDEPGKPIIFQVSNPPSFEINYVVSTLNTSLNRTNRSFSRPTTNTPLSSSRRNVEVSKRAREPYEFNEEDVSSFGGDNLRTERNSNRSIEKLSSPAIPNGQIINTPPMDRLGTQREITPLTDLISPNVLSEYDKVPSDVFDVPGSAVTSNLKPKKRTSDTPSDFVKKIFIRCYKKSCVLDSLKRDVLAESSD